MDSPKTTKIVRTYTADERELRMLEILAGYHGFSKSATIRNLIKKEFWRVFPAGTEDVLPEPGARIRGGEPRSTEARPADDLGDSSQG